MPQSSSKTISQDQSVADIDLKDPRLAAFLAWLVPGLGHIYQGRTGKGVLFFVCIVGTFIYGLCIGQGRVVYASTADVFSREFLERWQYICQIGAGLPALPALVQRARVRDHKEPLVADWFMRPPYKVPPAGVGEFTSPDNANNTVYHPDELAKWNYELGDLFELGTVFTVIAGLLNILAVYDAYGGPLVLPIEDKKKADDPSSNSTADKQ